MEEQRRGVQRYVDGLEDVAYDVSDVIFLDPEDPPCSEIPVQYGVLRCKGKGLDGRRCGYVVGSAQMIQALRPLGVQDKVISHATIS
jgi:hypothetical protein